MATCTELPRPFSTLNVFVWMATSCTESGLGKSSAGEAPVQFADFYNSARLASGYAFARPPVHPLVIERIVAHRTLAARSIGSRPRRRLRCGAFDRGAHRRAAHDCRHRACGRHARASPRGRAGSVVRRGARRGSPVRERFIRSGHRGRVAELHGPGPIARRNRTRARARRRAGDLRLLERTALPRGCLTRRLVRRVRAAIPLSSRVCAGRAGARLRATPVFASRRTNRSRSRCRSPSRRISHTC